ncbi:hypothetical protein [Pseudogemmobacter sonorensis]|uniref:hypothetical protein n=1 Tax=Pseudogemmobacter sonorensis TaxID=2989681 RepID=UPI0036CE6A56
MAIWIGLGLMALAFWGGLLWRLAPPRMLDDAAFAAAYATPLPPPEGGIRVYHLGHSLVGRDMPAMLAAAGGHGWNSQLGWGASLKSHLDGTVPGFAEENATPAFRPADEAAASADYPVFVLTEMVELKDAIRYHDSAAALAEWARRIRAANPGARIYLYETWHRTDDPAGWLERIDGDLALLWEGRLLRPAMAAPGVGTIHVIPGGQVMAAVMREAEAGRIPGVNGREDLLSDEIHFSDLGAWVMAMTHFAVIHGRSPLGLPHVLPKADGTPGGAPSEPAARAIQEVVWRVVTSYAATGVARRDGLPPVMQDG